MAIQFNPNALRMFSNVNLGDDNAIANLGGENNLVQKKSLGSIFLKPFRSGETEKRNNAVRTELLKALGQAFNLHGVTEQDGRTTFSDEFMRRLSDILGPAFRSGDFGIKDGAVASGKPLTQRRIKAICNAALAKAEMPYDGKAYNAKIDSLMDRFSGKRMDPLAVLKLREYALAVRKTIEFLENGMDGFDEAFANRSLDEIGKFVFNRTRLTFLPEDITAALERKGVADPANPPADQVKDYIRERLETMVKTTVDRCLETTKPDDCVQMVDAIYRNYYRVESALLALEK